MSKTKSKRTLDQAFSKINKELLQMFLKKHKDYGKGNVLSMKELGIAMRVGEKVERLKHLLMKEMVDPKAKPTNESIEETWTDIGVFAVIALLFRRGQFQELEVDEKAMEKVK
jgi:hypothetical protein